MGRLMCEIEMAGLEHNDLVRNDLVRGKQCH